jgi:ferrous iron transport protein B
MVGTPNVGKTSLVNALAGSRLQVGNWPGTTIDVETARTSMGGRPVDLLDLPGAYTLAGTASDEEVLLPALDGDPDALIVNVVDATHLARDLTLTLELSELDRPMVVALNLVDQARRRGASVDAGALAGALGVPVVAVGAHVGSGVTALVEAAAHASTSSFRVAYPAAIAAAAARVGEHTATRWHALAALTDEIRTPLVAAGVGVGATGAPLGTGPGAAVAHGERIALADGGVDAFLAVAEARHRAAHALAAASTMPGARAHDPSDRIDRVLLHPLIGPLALIVGLALTFHLTFALSSPWIAFLGTVQEVLAGWIAALALPPLLASFLAGALVEGVGTVVAFVPVLYTLYAILALLENAGILARVAFLADGLMRRVGLPGRAVLPMVLSIGCTVPAIGAARMLDDRSERLRVVLALPSIPCGARLPVFVLLSAAFVPAYAAVVVTGLYLLGFAVAVASALAFKHLLRTPPTSSAMELPAYRLPPPRLVLRLAWARTRAFLAGAGGPILIAVVVVWALLTAQTPAGTSVFELVARALAPVFAPLGMDDWRVVGALIPGAVAKEVVIGSMAIAFLGGETTEALGGLAGIGVIAAAFVEAVQETLGALWGFGGAVDAPDAALGSRLSDALSVAGALALMVFTLLYVPCVATLAAIRKAFGARYALLSAGYQLTIAYVAAFVVFRLFS